ncbi:MAG: thermonuclease family protein [Candidatus Omnitrophota bacterium]
MRLNKRIAFWGLLILGSPLFTSRISTATDSLTVARCVDGDTIKLSNGEKVRLIGVDTPELHHPSKPVQYFAEEAYQFVKKLMEGKEIRLEYDWEKKDKYGRTLAYVYRDSDGLFLNAEIIKQGYGFAYTRFPFKRLEEFRKLEQEAREKQLGLWKMTVGDDEIKGLIAEYEGLTEEQRKSVLDYIAKLKLSEQIRRKENETTTPVSR